MFYVYNSNSWISKIFSRYLKFVFLYVITSTDLYIFLYSNFQNLDLTQHRLIYDGTLTMKIGDTRKIRTIELHVVLLEDCIMLLQKQDDKYLLKFHTSTAGPGIGAAASGKFNHSPVIKFSTLLVRPVATDERAFYLLNTTQNGPKIYELFASSTADRSQWFRHITEASNAYKQRENRRYPQGGDSSTGGGWSWR